ncbi:MAG: hypothetical protein WCD89_17665 [Anaerocolumna sp.]
MANERFTKKEMDLKKLIPSNHFRTVESFAMRKVKSETNVEIELKDSFMQSLNFKAPWDGKLYAYARHTDEFIDFLKENGLGIEDLKTIYMQDWDNFFNIIFEGSNIKKEVSFFASKEDMKNLLENCCRIQEQK